MTNSAPTASVETDQIREHVQYLEARFDQLEANVSDFRFQVGEDLDDFSTALDAVGTRLDEQQAHTITQDQVDKLDQLRQKAEQLIAEAPVNPSSGSDTETPTETPDSTDTEPGTAVDDSGADTGSSTDLT